MTNFQQKEQELLEEHKKEMDLFEQGVNEEIRALGEELKDVQDRHQEEITQLQDEINRLHKRAGSREPEDIPLETRYESDWSQMPEDTPEARAAKRF